MALSLKNSVISLTLSGLMVFAAYVTGDSPIMSTKQTASTGMNSTAIAQEGSTPPKTMKKAKRTFTTPYFSFGKSNLPAGVR